MGNIGPLEIVVVLVIALLVLGPKRLPEVGKSVGRGMREFKDGIAGIADGKDDDEQEAPVPSQVTPPSEATPPSERPVA